MILGGSNYIDSTGSGWYKAETETLEEFIGCTSFGYQKTSAKPDAANSKHRGQVETSNARKLGNSLDPAIFGLARGIGRRLSTSY